MKAARKTVLEAVVLSALGVMIAIAVNAVRASTESIKFSKNYFDKGIGRVMPAGSEQSPGSDHLSPEGVPAIAPRSPHDSIDSTDSSAHATAQKEEYPFQEVTFEQVAEVFYNPDTAGGANVFVDARNDREYEAGHIPGAIQADHYRLGDYIDLLLDYAESAEKIIVYCNGGSCEDSIFLCSDLLDYKISCDRICLYLGGWTEWVDKGMPVAKGRE